MSSPENTADDKNQCFQNLYVRRKKIVKGPYPRSLIRNYLLIGRLRMNDEVSGDKENWFQIKDDKTLIPKEMINVKSKEDKDKLKLAQRRQDERAEDRRRKGAILSEKDRRDSDRRIDESEELKQYREKRSKLSKQYGRINYSFFSVLIFIGIISGLSYVTYLIVNQIPTKISVAVNCNAKPRPGINWKNCKLEGIVVVVKDMTGAFLQNTNLRGADLHGSNLSGSDISYANLNAAKLSYTNLSHAILIGAGLRDADLTNADLSNANLSYANLKGAQLGGARMKGINLSRTIWIDGTICKQGSIGTCLK